MSVHVFTVSEDNYITCLERGIVALPEPKGGRTHDNIFDGLLSRLCGVKENDCQTQTPSYAGENGINSSVEAGESLR